MGEVAAAGEAEEDLEVLVDEAALGAVEVLTKAPVVVAVEASAGEAEAGAVEAPGEVAGVEVE